MNPILPVRYLERKNVLKETENIDFHDEGHLYFGKSRFYENTVSTTEGAGGLPLISSTTILKKYFPFNSRFIAARIWENIENRVKMETDENYKYYGCKSIQDIEDKWSAGSKEGTAMHNFFEDLSNLVQHDRDLNTNFTQLYDKRFLKGKNEKKMFYGFIESFKLGKDGGNFEIYRTELPIWNEVLHIAGMIDLVLYDTVADGYMLVDWKRVKGGIKGDPTGPRALPVEKLKAGSKGRILPAFKKRRNNSLNTYGCQLTLYKHLFEFMTGKRVLGLFIVAANSELIHLSNDEMAELNLKSKKKKLRWEVTNIPLEEYDECVLQAFHQRACDMIENCLSTLSDEHFNALRNYIIPNLN